MATTWTDRLAELGIELPSVVPPVPAHAARPAVPAPRPAVPRAKMVANMVDMKKKTASRAMGETLSMPAATISVSPSPMPAPWRITPFPARSRRF